MYSIQSFTLKMYNFPLVQKSSVEETLIQLHEQLIKAEGKIKALNEENERRMDLYTASQEEVLVCSYTTLYKKKQYALCNIIQKAEYNEHVLEQKVEELEKQVQHLHYVSSGSNTFIYTAGGGTGDSSQGYCSTISEGWLPHISQQQYVIMHYVHPFFSSPHAMRWFSSELSYSVARRS